jgi:acyl carrier protein
MEYRNKVRQFIIENYLYGEDIGIESEISFLGKGILDSTGILELIAFLEQTFDIQINDEEIIPDNLDSLTKIENYLIVKIGVR